LDEFKALELDGAVIVLMPKAASTCWAWAATAIRKNAKNDARKVFFLKGLSSVRL
jgi:hypothetical protein